jgi:hypothetical protein
VVEHGEEQAERDEDQVQEALPPHHGRAVGTDDQAGDLLFVVPIHTLVDRWTVTSLQVADRA